MVHIQIVQEKPDAASRKIDCELQILGKLSHVVVVVQVFRHVAMDTTGSVYLSHVSFTGITNCG